MQDANNRYAVLDSAIKDHVTAVCQAAELWGKLGAGAAHQRMRCEQATTVLKHPDEPPGIDRIVASNKITDVNEIALGLLSEPELRHPASTARETLLQPREHLVPIAYPAGFQIIEPCLQVSF